MPTSHDLYYCCVMRFPESSQRDGSMVSTPINQNTNYPRHLNHFCCRVRRLLNATKQVLECLSGGAVASSATCVARCIHCACTENLRNSLRFNRSFYVYGLRYALMTARSTNSPVWLVLRWMGGAVLTAMVSVEIANGRLLYVCALDTRQTLDAFLHWRCHEKPRIVPQHLLQVVTRNFSIKKAFIRVGHTQHPRGSRVFFIRSVVNLCQRAQISRWG